MEWLPWNSRQHPARAPKTLTGWLAVNSQDEGAWAARPRSQNSKSQEDWECLQGELPTKVQLAKVPSRNFRVPV
jgi:hypothetical protein